MVRMGSWVRIPLSAYMTKVSKVILGLIILFALIWAAYFIYIEKERFWPEIPEGEIPPESEIKQSKMAPPERAQEEPQLNLKAVEMMNYISDNIEELSPVEPVLAGQWQVIRFWFVADYDFYVEYEDGHILRQIFISARGRDVDVQYNVIAYFEPGENEWVLKKGEDIMYGKETILFERDEETNMWVRRN